MPVKHKQVNQVATSFHGQTEILREKLEEVSLLDQEPFHPDTDAPKTKEVRLLRNGLVLMLSNYTTTYTEISEIFDRYLTDMEEGDDRDEQDEASRQMTSTYTKMLPKVHDGIETLGLLLERYQDLIQKEKEKEEKEQQDAKDEAELKRKQRIEDEERHHRSQLENDKLRTNQAEIDGNMQLRKQEMDLKHLEEMERLQITDRHSASVTFGEGARCETSAGIKLPKVQLKPFSGNLLEFQEFWEMYNATVHSKRGISEVEKFNLLKTFLKGDAEALIKGFSVTSVNY